MIEVWMILVGSAVHELYGWTGNNSIVALFAPIDESLWEHFKLGYGAILLWIPVERWILHRGGNTYVFARAAGLILLNLVVIAMFFTIRPMVDEPLTLVVDIGSYVLGSLALGQVVRRYSDRSSPVLHRIGVPLLVLIGLAFAAFTIWKPDHIWFIEHSW